jgi:hypothetical protein
MTDKTYSGLTVAKLREYIAHTFDAENGGDTIDELTQSSGTSANVIRDLLDALESSGATAFQSRVQPWMMGCFGAEISADRVERNHRFFEESTEAVQANGMTRSEAHQLVDYTYDRPVGELKQEVGGVMVTLAALCLASGVDMHEAGEVELARISAPETMAKIRAKQAAKPKHSPLPMGAPGDHTYRAPYEWSDTGPLETEAPL